MSPRQLGFLLFVPFQTFYPQIYDLLKAFTVLINRQTTSGTTDSTQHLKVVCNVENEQVFPGNRDAQS